MQPDGFIDHVSIPWGADYEIVYTSTSGNCTDTLLLEVTGADAGLDTSSCTGTSTFFLPEALPPGGEWSGFPLNSPADINIIDPFTGEVSSDGLAGDYVFVYETFGASGKGCPDSVTIKVCGSNDVWVPNIFSPNGDDENDIMFVRGIAVDWVLIRIYDRWGELIYDSSKDGDAMLQGWDGTYKGKELTPQVFVYYLEGAFLDGEEFDEEDRQGNITLVK
jgi:gliding motility-associated-like protein